MAELNDTSLINDANLLAYYRFNSGALTTDSSTNARTLTNNNSVGETVGGKYGYSTDYGITNTNKTLSRSEDIWGNGAFSYVGWFKTYDNSENNGIVWITDSTTNKYMYGWSNNGTIGFGHERVGVSPDLITGTVAMDNNWHHYAFTINAIPGTMSLYHNGTLMGTIASTTGTGSVGQGDAYHIGRSDGQFMKGYIDDSAFFNRTLTGAEIGELAATGNTLDLISKIW